MQRRRYLLAYASLDLTIAATRFAKGLSRALGNLPANYRSFEQPAYLDCRCRIAGLGTVLVACAAALAGIKSGARGCFDCYSRRLAHIWHATWYGVDGLCARRRLWSPSGWLDNLQHHAALQHDGGNRTF